MNSQYSKYDDESYDNVTSPSVGRRIFNVCKGIGCFLLGIVLAVSHYVFSVVAAVFTTFFRIALGIRNLYAIVKPSGFLQGLYFVFKALFVAMYHLIKLPFLLIYRATVGFFESVIMAVKPMYSRYT